MIDQKNVDLYFDYIDNACLIIYEETHLDYLDCLIRVGNDIIEGVNDTGLSSESINKLEEIYERIFSHSFLNEEIRLAMQLLIVKGFKHHDSFSLDLMTPDSICYLFAFIISLYFDDEKRITILDTALGTGNLINAISNFCTRENYDLSLIGIEKEQKLAELAKVNTDLQGNEIQIYLNDALSPNYFLADVIIGDIDTNYIDDKYFPYLLINRFIDNLNEDGIFIYLIANDFFNQKDVKEFKNAFSGTFLGLIVLPDTLFQDNVVGKSILIGTNKRINNYDMLVMNLASLVDKEKVQESINNITEWIINLKGMIN